MLHFLSHYCGSRTAFITNKVKLKPTRTWAYRQLCTSPHNSNDWDSKMIGGLRFRACSLLLGSVFDKAKMCLGPIRKGQELHMTVCC